MTSLINKDDTLFLYYTTLLKGGQIDESVLQLRDEFKFEWLLRNLDLPSQLKVRNIKNELDRYVKLINMLILSYVVSTVENKMSKLEMTRNKYGKPKMLNRKYQFNISDENGLVSIAIGFNENMEAEDIGMDLANPKDIERFELSDLAHFYRKDFRGIFGDKEIEWLDRKFERLDYNKRLQLLSQCWALKESYCKYLGVGITAGMENFPFTDVRVLKNVHGDCFELSPIVGYKPLNLCLKIPESEIILSVFSHYSKAKLEKIDVKTIIDYFLNKV